MRNLSIHFRLGWTPQLVPAGTYRFIYRKEEHGSGTLTLVDSFELPAGALVEVEM